MAKSRLSKRMEQKTKKNLLLSVLGIILILLLVFKFGLPLLINLSLFLSGSKAQVQLEKKDPSFIAPPVLNSLPQATSSAKIIISGISSKDQIIKLYLNDDFIDEDKTKEDGTFSFEEEIKAGENIIKAKAVEDDKESEFSQSITIALKSAPPSLQVNSPSDGQSYKDQNTADVQGTTDPDVKITVNGFWAITDSDGSFSYRLPLQNGENKIKIVAMDIAGNKKELEVKVTFSP
ncbi:MAG: hypothetical protein HYW62_02800 [Candidatus Levybacteria bacterium]|nr:hypothetical protein [Candidatus Levybacteria bacterium]